MKKDFKKNKKKPLFFRNSDVFGVDFNGSNLRIMQLKRDGKFKKIRGWVEKGIPQGVMNGIFIEKEELFFDFFSKTLKEATGKIKGKRLIISLPENKIFTRIIKIPLMERDEAEEPVRFEMESNIPIPIDEIYFDWQIVKRNKKDMDVLVVASPMKIIDNYLNVFENFGYQIVAVEPKSVSIGRSVINSSKEDDYLMVVDMGLENSSYAIYEKGFPIFTSSGSVSGKILTDLAMKTLGLTLEKAEAYKIKIGLGESPEEKEEAFRVFGPALETLTEEIKRTLNFFSETLASQREEDETEKIEIKKIIFTGGGSNLKGLNSFLSINLQESIEQANPWVNVPFKKDLPPISKEDSQGFSSVIGSALRAQDYENYN